MSGPDIMVAIEDARAGVQSRANVQLRAGVQPRVVAPFRANLVLTVADNADVTFGQWQRASDEALPTLLKGYELLDLEKLRVAGHPGGRRLARHLSTEGEVLVMQQWFTVFGHLGVTLTATCDLGSYRLLLPQIRTAASSLALPPPGHAPSRT
ncbi:MAG: hypothetical protein WA991_04135 [Ornithinimicrobium sp.]